MAKKLRNQELKSADSICPLTERPHNVSRMKDADLLQCEACQDIFPIPPGYPPDAPGGSRSDDLTGPAPTPLGTVHVDPEANTAAVELSPEGLRRLANDVIQEWAKTDLGTDLPHMIAFTMVGVAYLKHMGMDHNNIMQVCSLAYNGNVTGLFALQFEGESGETPEAPGH